MKDGPATSDSPNNVELMMPNCILIHFPAQGLVIPDGNRRGPPLVEPQRWGHLLSLGSPLEASPSLLQDGFVGGHVFPGSIFPAREHA
jgi:hypothetical protein